MLHVKLALDDQRLSLDGEVAHSRGHQYGISFRDVVSAGFLDPPESLRRIVRLLERPWLRERTRTADQNTKG
jgi:hypothetical protein